MDQIYKLRTKFVTEEVEINHPAEINEIIAFEKRNSVKLPEILKTYFSIFNGTGQGNFGDDGFAFFSLDEFSLAEKEATDSEPDKYAYPNCYVFSDYLCWCWGYAVKLDDKGSDGPVYQVTGEKPPVRKVSSSFSEFIRQYLENSDELL